MRVLARGRWWWGIGLLGCRLAAGQTPPAPPSGAPAIELSRASVPAAGRHEAIVRVAKPGRYAVLATSRSGTALTLVDRMAGPGTVAGKAGESDGRLDLLLDRGEYKLVAEGSETARGEARLEAHAFAERQPGEAPQLVERKLVSGTLGDLEQVSWWLVVSSRRVVAIEAAGRSLADLRLWADGSWLVDARPAPARVVPEPGRPLRVLRLAAALEPGNYLLTAYGGTSEPWAEESASQPLHLRFGIDRLGVAGRSRRVMGPLGVERFVVPGQANVFRLELPEAEEARISVGTYDEDDPYLASGESAAVEKNSVPPAVTLRPGSAMEPRVVTVTLAAGRPYVLQHLEQSASYPFEGSGPHWVSTVHTGHAEDSIDATAIVVRSGPRRGDPPAPRLEPLAAAAVEIDPERAWRRRFNLLGEVSLHLHVAADGKYEIVSRGTPARFAIAPFLVTRPKQMEGLELETGERTWDLPGGWYELSISPDRPGIADVELRPASLLGGIAASETAVEPVRAAVAFPSLALDRDRAYTIYLGRQPEVDAGAIVRPLPLDLAEPLPLALRPGESVEVDLQAGEAGKLRAEAEDGSALEVAVDGHAFGRAPRVEAGRHRATVRNGGEATAIASLSFLAASLDPSTPLAPLPPGARRALPDMPLLAAGEPRFLDLDHDQPATFLVRAPQIGLYELGSTGLLATTGVVRTRIQPELLRAEEGGSGRNFRIGAYLRQGDYQLTLRPRGQSRGHLGVRLARTRLADGGKLDLGVPARISLAAGDAVVYRFTVAEAGPHRIESLGLGRSFRCRLEDADGWPLLAPGGDASFLHRFEPGTYRLLLLPEAVESRRVTTVSRIRPPPRFEGHGPHELALAAPAAGVWTEPEGDGARAPDVWQFEMPAPADVTVELGGEMHGPIARQTGDGTFAEVAYVPPLRGFRGRLEAGRHRLSATCVRRNNRVSYGLEVTPRELVPGLERRVQAPSEVPLSIGADTPVEIASSGSADVRATLWDAGGREVGRSDDRPDDWNFRIAAMLAAGSYRLRVDPVGASAAETTVALRLPREVAGKPLALPAAKDLVLRNLAGAWPIATPPLLDGLLVAALEADEAAGVGIEEKRGESWSAIATAEGRAPRVAVPVAGVAATELRVRVWRLGRPGMRARLAVALANPEPSSEAALASGLTLARIDGLEPAMAAARVVLDRPGLFRFADPPPELVLSAMGGAAEAVPPSGLVLAGGEGLWLVAPAAKDAPAAVSASRERLRVGAALVLRIDPRQAAIDLDPGTTTGPLLLEVETPAGQPGASLLATGIDDLAADPRRAAAASPDPSPRIARLWRADEEPGPLEARIRLTGFPAARPERVPLGVASGTLDPGTARALLLPPGPKSIRLVLASGVTALLAAGGTSGRDLVRAAAEAEVETLVTEATTLTLLSTGNRPGHWWARIAAASPRALSPAAPVWEGRPDAAGTERLRFSGLPCPAVPARLRIEGGDRDAVVLFADGRVRRGRDLEIGPGLGTLRIPHRTSPVAAWLACPGEEASAIWGRASEAQLQSFEPATPSILHLRAPVPAVTRLERPGLPVAAACHTGTLALDAWLPAGKSTLYLRPFGGTAWEPVEDGWIEPIEPIAEGLGPEVLLAPGGSRLLGFRLEQETTIGLGVQVLLGRVACMLRDGAGEPLGEGVVQMKTLPPGSYLVELKAPADGGPARARPALAGLVPRGLGPPEEIVRGYLGLAGHALPGETGFGRVTAPAAPLAAGAYGPRELLPPEDDGEESAPGDDSEPAQDDEGDVDGEGDVDETGESEGGE